MYKCIYFYITYLQIILKFNFSNGKPCLLKEDSSDMESGNRRKKDRFNRSNDPSESEHNEVIVF